MAGKQSAERRKQRIYQLRKECTSKGIGFVSHVGSVQELERRLANPYPWQLDTWERKTGIKPFNFSGITPKPGSYVRWKPKGRWARESVRGIGRLVSFSEDSAVIRYDMLLGNGYKSRRITVHPFQITEYREGR